MGGVEACIRLSADFESPALEGLAEFLTSKTKNRPKRLGTTMCRIVRVVGTQLFVADLDAIDGTPVLDLKPVMSEFLPREPVRQPQWSRELMRENWSRRS